MSLISDVFYFLLTSHVTQKIYDDDDDDPLITNLTSILLKENGEMTSIHLEPQDGKIVLIIMIDLNR